MAALINLDLTMVFDLMVAALAGVFSFRLYKKSKKG